MKIRKKVLISLLMVGMFSCSDNLTESKAKKIIEKCQENNLKNKYTIYYIETGEVELSETRKSDKKELENLMELKNNGVITIEQLKSTSYGTIIYNVSFTDKAEEYIIEKNVRKGGLNFFSERVYQKNEVRTSSLVIDEVSNIQEIPSMNIAKMEVKFKKDEKTPFYPLEGDENDFVIKKVEFAKTNDKGWVYCTEN